MKYFIIFIFIITHLFTGNELGYSDSSPLWTHFTYQFQHLNWIHLTLNSFAFISFYNVLQKALPEYLILFYSYTISLLASFLSMYNLPTVGASGMIYAMTGLFVSISIIGKKLKIIDRLKFKVFISCILISMLLSGLRSDINFSCHIISFFLGLIMGIADNTLYEGYTKHHQRK